MELAPCLRTAAWAVRLLPERRRSTPAPAPPSTCYQFPTDFHLSPAPSQAEAPSVPLTEGQALASRMPVLCQLPRRTRGMHYLTQSPEVLRVQAPPFTNREPEAGRDTASQRPQRKRGHRSSRAREALPAPGTADCPPLWASLHRLGFDHPNWSVPRSRRSPVITRRCLGSIRSRQKFLMVSSLFCAYLVTNWNQES